MIRKVIAYLAHPVSAPDREGIEANLANARAWLKWFICNTTWAVSAPWMPYVESLDEERFRERGLADDLSMLERHDLIVLVGGQISSGMRVEKAFAEDFGIPVLDLTDCGRSPSNLVPRLHLRAAERMVEELARSKAAP